MGDERGRRVVYILYSGYSWMHQSKPLMWRGGRGREQADVGREPLFSVPYLQRGRELKQLQAKGSLHIELHALLAVYHNRIVEQRLSY